MQQKASRCWRNVMPINSSRQLISHTSSGSGFKALFSVSFVSQLVGHVVCFSLLPSALCQLGESGLGKSTLVNSLFLTDLYKDRKLLNAEGKLGQRGSSGILHPQVCSILRTSPLAPCFSSSYSLAGSQPWLLLLCSPLLAAEALGSKQEGSGCRVLLPYEGEVRLQSSTNPLG